MTDISEERPVLSGRYELHRRIARGGMAEVFLARDQLLDRPVAVKVLFPQYAADPTFVARFRREAQAAANLNHPSIVAVYDWGHQDETYFIVMEYVEGQSLAELLVEEGPLDIHRATEIVADVASALGFAHRNGTVHRDVKPGNIMITNDDKVKVADFGIARAFGGADDQLTQVGSVMGTASYFSPEQAQGKQVDPRSDIYSLGVVLFEMITGQTPFTGESPVAIAYKHVQETPPRPSLMNPSVTPELESVIARMLAKNPEQRYGTAEDLRGDLHRYRQGQPLAPGYESNGAAAGSVNGDATRLEPVSRAVIDTTRAVPASVASGRSEPVEEYYEQPNRTGVFLVALLGLLVVLVGVVVWIVSSFGGADGDIADGEVPNVVGETQADATKTIEDANFEVVPQRGPSDLEPGLVFDQDPKGGTALAEEGTITIFISEGAETVTVPDVVGRSLAVAEQTLRELGFDPKIERELSDEFAEDDVISVSPGVGEEADQGSTVILVVSDGGQMVTIPDLRGDVQGKATDTLEDLGFVVAGLVKETSANVPEGQVIRTDPEVGQSVTKGSEVQIFVSTGNAEAIVPDVKGMTEGDAKASLNSAGFTNVVTVTVAVLAPDSGKVVSQNPAAGTNQDTSMAITLTVGLTPRQTPNSTSTTVAPTTTLPVLPVP